MLPRAWADHVREAYRIDLATEYLGQRLPHPIGKASGQLSLKAEQLEADAEAGLAFVVLKTVIGEDAGGARTMAAWAIHETKMKVERRKFDGREGWTVTWKGRGWDGTLGEYLALLEFGRDLARSGGPLTVPSVKLHLPRLEEEFSRGEYEHTIGLLARAWRDAPLLIEKDFSPTLAGDALADEQERILRWIDEVPGRIRDAAPGGARVALKLMNARFDDAFQVRMLARAGQSADAVTAFNRLWDPGVGAAYGGWELSDRNLRVLRRARPGVPLSGTGNSCSGTLIADYARAGCSSVQLHTMFQLPLSAYPASDGSRTVRTLHKLVFDPADGLIAALLAAEQRDELARVGGELRFRDLVGRAP
ncbi:MAG TPA: hypothetical protein VFT04_11090 [Gemmatimonadales bacterium]|nr:hypothetical protein [Gemmatimonadales bacterium]